MMIERYRLEIHPRLDTYHHLLRLSLWNCLGAIIPYLDLLSTLALSGSQ